MISARTTWLALMPLIVMACNPIRSTSFQPEFDPLPRLDTLVNLDKPDLTLIAINGRGPDNRPIRISRGSSPGLTGYTYDQQGRLLARYDPTVFGWNDYELGQYEGQRLAQVYKGATFYPTEPIEYAATVARYGYNQQQQINYTLYYQYSGQASRYRLTWIEQYRYNSAGQIQASLLTSTLDQSYRRTEWVGGRPSRRQSFTKQGVATSDSVRYGYDTQPNPFSGLYFFGFDSESQGSPTNLVENQTVGGIFRREYKVDYDERGRIRTRYVRQLPGEAWFAEHLFYYNP